jgi:uncharacterized membrane protein YphA (DoxX/SURF4 family)
MKSITDKFAPYVPLVIRLIVGIIFLSHGLQKVGNPSGIAGYLGFLGVPLPGVMGWFILLLEVVGGAALILGLATRWVAALFVIEMLVAAVLAKMSQGVPLVAEAAAGYELDLALLAACLALVIMGSGLLSIERNVLKREL